VGLSPEGVRNPFMIATDIDQCNFEKKEFGEEVPLRGVIIVEPHKGTFHIPEFRKHFLKIS